MATPDPALPPSAAFDAPAIRRRLAEVAARGLSRFVGAFGTVLLVVTAVDRLLRPQGLAPAWVALGALSVAAALVGWGLLRTGRANAAATAVLVMISGAIAWQSWAIGLGIHSAGLAGLCLLVALAGMLVGLRSALLLALLYAAVVAFMAWGEARGLIDGRAAVASTPMASRLIALSMVGIAGLLAAWVLNRLIGQLMTATVGEQLRLAELLRIGSDWTWEMDAHARPTYLSPSFEARTGRNAAEFMALGTPAGPQVIDDAASQALFDDLRQRRPYRDRDISFRCHDGTVLVVRGNGAPVFDAGGTLVGWRGVARNVTAERLAELEKRRSDQLLDRLVQISPDAICVARLTDGTLLLANPAFRQQVPAGEVIGRNAVDLGLWTDHAESRRLRDALRQGAGVVRDMRTLVHLPGQAPRVMLLTAAAFDWSGEPVAVITTRDVTDAERARREADAILDNASIGIALVRDRRFERVNPNFETMFGRPVGSLAGQPTATMFPSRESFEGFAAESDAAQLTHGVLDIEREVPMPDGRTMLARLRAGPVDNAQPLAGGTIWVAEDVTDRRRFERALAAAKQQAEAANDAKSSFLATMSHEIRTPLNGLLGLARLLQEPSLDASRRAEYLSHLVDAAELLSGMVSDVLDLSKIEAGQLTLESIAFDLHSVVDSTFRTFAALGRERGLTMDCTIDPAVPRRMRGDPVRVRQILANYLSNALKFTARGRIGLRLDAAGAGRIRVVVQDTGVGVSPALQAQLFEPFVQADSSTTRHFGGTGLGLSICHELAKLMGGRVGVDSDGAQGSVFWAELPLPADADAAAEAIATGHADQPLRGLRVLVAEDNPVNTLIIREMLRRRGAEVLHAGDGEQAVRMAMAEPPGALHAVLMDLHMPVVDGLAAARRLRDDPRTAGLPVLAMSAAVLDHDRQAAEAAGMRGFIAKPVAEPELLRALAPLVPRTAVA